jgi:AraC-like DNA-binding protein/mannose-6-phosphate isomerase-like protein (cupin superfamily)
MFPAPDGFCGCSGGHSPGTIASVFLPLGARACPIGRIARTVARATAKLDESTGTDMDALSELLSAVKLSGAMFYVAECSKPWRVLAPPASKLGKYVAPNASHVIEFHLVTQGSGYVRVGEETTPFSAGDLFMIPHGDAHEMGNGTGAEVIDAEPTLPALLEGGLKRSRLGGGGEETRLVCGYLACDAGLIRPVLAGLPRVVRVHVRNDRAGEWLENSISHAVERASAAVPGSDVILARLAEVLFADALQRYVSQLPAGRTGWLAGAGDATVGRSLAALHRRPAHPWTLDELADQAAVSRSVLTDRFARYLGQSPMAYLADWRIELGAEALRTSSRSVLQVATDVGYESEAAFNRAFKRKIGKPPAQYRRAFREQKRAAVVRSA